MGSEPLGAPAERLRNGSVGMLADERGRGS